MTIKKNTIFIKNEKGNTVSSYANIRILSRVDPLDCVLSNSMHTPSIHSYRTLDSPSEGVYREKGSRFLAFAFPINSEENVKMHLEQLRKKYHDARHHCYAYRLAPDGALFRANDDGEPSGTAGKPILGQLLSFEVTQILVVVVRYFGGVKLGTGGLIQAYKAAAREALSQAVIIEKEVRVYYRLSFPYTLLNEVMRMLKETQAEIEGQEMGEAAAIRCSIPLAQQETLTDRWQRMQGLEYSLVEGW